MKETTGNIWTFHAKGFWVGITVNGSLRHVPKPADTWNVENIMGCGVALDAKRKYPELPYLLGGCIEAGGNHVNAFHAFRVITYPVKHLASNWRADLQLIEQSAHELVAAYSYLATADPVYLVQPGTGAGRLKWDEVKPVIEKILDDRFVVVKYEHG